MPVIHFYCPALPKENKESLVRDFAQAASKATGIPAEKMVTYIHEMESENIGLGEVLLANRK